MPTTTVPTTTATATTPPSPQSSTPPTTPTSGDDVLGVLTLQIIGAQNLHIPPRYYRRYRRVNPFAIVSYGRQAFRTKWLRATVSPTWNETVQLVVKQAELETYLVVLSVYDYDRIGCNVCLGSTNVRVKYFCDRPDEQVNLALEIEGEQQNNCFIFVKGVYKTLSSLLSDLQSHFGTDLGKATTCPVCQRGQSGGKGLVHAALCYNRHRHGSANCSVGGYVTEEYASRKWFNRLFEMLGFGGYRVGHNSGHILVHDRRTGRVVEERIPMSIKLAISWMHQNNVNRRAIDRPMIRTLLHILTVRQGQVYDDPCSVKYIPDFVHYHKLNMDEVDLDLGQFKTFNEFFYRKLKPGARVLSSTAPTVMASPADCRLHCYSTVTEATELWIKGRRFCIESLLNDELEARQYIGGSLVICRLAPQDYHRFHSPVDGVIDKIVRFDGAYFTVNPMAIRQNLDILTKNARTVIYIDSHHHGRVAFVAVGAMMVGSIVLTTRSKATVKRMDEIGYFAFGGSTVVLVLAKDAVCFDGDLLENSQQPIETLVQVGDRIGHSPHQ